MSDVQTYGLTDPEEERDPVTGELVSSTPQVSTSGPSAPGGQANVSGAPLSGNQAADSRVGGPEPSQPSGPDLSQDQGPVETMVQEQAHKDPDKFSQDIDATYQAIRKRRATAGDKAAQLELELLNERMGIDGEQAKEEIFRQAEVGIERAEQDNKITAKQAKQKRFELKNIYKTIKPEEMSLFLIDFGMRAMMAGETMGDLGALGAAGSGAMGALQERRRFAGEQDIAAGERAATDYAKAQELALEERRVGAAETTAQAALTRAESVGAGYQGKDKFLLDFYRTQGRSDEWIAQQLSGAGSYEQVYDRASEQVEKIYAKAIENPPIGSSTINAIPVTVGEEDTYMHKLTPNQRAQLAREITDERMANRSQGSALNRALISSQEE